MHPAKAKEPWSGDRLQIPEFHEISESCKTRIRQLLRSPYDSGRKSCWNARDLKQALNIHVLGSTTGTNLRSHSITTFNHYDRRIRIQLYSCTAMRNTRCDTRTSIHVPYSCRHSYTRCDNSRHSLRFMVLVRVPRYSIQYPRGSYMYRYVAS
jgi:hypothetical protein